MSSEIVELRQYLLHHGRRDELIELFDREFVESQEQTGMAVLGQFRDPDRPDYFVWLRGFPDIESRHASLTSFYNGPVWARYCDAANATMIDSDDVHLLGPLSPAHRIPPHDPSRRGNARLGFVMVAIVSSNDRAADLAASQPAIATWMAASEITEIGCYRTERSPNTFTRLPVHTDDVLVWFGVSLADPDAAWQALTARDAPAGITWELHRLLPTHRSALDGTAPMPSR